jgi:hypothetical protein
MNETQNLHSEQALAQNIEHFLQEIVEAADPMSKTGAYYAGRPTTLPALVLWSSVLVGVLRGFTSQLAIWRLIAWSGFWGYTPYQLSDQAVYNRLADGGSAAMGHLFYQVRDGLKARLEPYAQTDLAKFASGVYAIDGSTLDKIGRYLPWLREIANGDSRLLPGKIVALFDLRRQQWAEMIHLDNPNQNDKVVAQELVENLPARSLILADLGFFGFAWFDYLTAKGYWWISRLREKTTHEVIHTYYKSATFFDGVIWLGKYRADRAAYAVRLVQFTIGSVQYQYITNVLDPQLLPMQEIALLYARRWDIELAFKMVKQYLKLHILWSAKTEVILLQVWAVLIISQLLQAIRLEIAGLAKVDPFDISMPLLIDYVPRLALEGKNPIEMIVNDGRRVGIIRPSRRIRIQTPVIDPAIIIPLPEGITLIRKPRYAQRKSLPRSWPPELLALFGPANSVAVT